MAWGQVLTIIFGVAGFMGIFALLINRQIDMVNKRIDDLKHDVDKRLDKIEEDIRELRGEIREIKELLYKVFGTETKK